VNRALLLQNSLAFSMSTISLSNELRALQASFAQKSLKLVTETILCLPGTRTISLNALEIILPRVL
jgi:hypothetical protein